MTHKFALHIDPIDHEHFHYEFTISSTKNMDEIWEIAYKISREYSIQKIGKVEEFILSYLGVEK